MAGAWRGASYSQIATLECRPIRAAWNPFYAGEVRCIPLLTEFICSSPINIITNLCLLFLPIPVLTGMRLPKRQKMAVVFLFSLGIFGMSHGCRLPDDLVRLADRLQ